MRIIDKILNHIVVTMVIVVGVSVIISAVICGAITRLYLWIIGEKIE